MLQMENNPVTRMMAFDRMPDDLRELANEFGVNPVRTWLSVGLKDPVEMRRRLEEARRNKPLWRWGVRDGR